MPNNEMTQKLNEIVEDAIEMLENIEYKEYIEENVMIELNSTQLVEGEEQHVDLVTKGIYFVDEKGYHIEYEETEATGFNGSTSAILYQPQYDRITMERTGENATQIIIEKNKRHLCNYGTPYGMLTIGVRGCKIKADLNEDGGILAFTYTLDVNTALASTNSINIRIKREN